MTAGPRNIAALEQSRSTREEIRSLLERHPTTAWSFTAKQIRRCLSRELSPRTIQWHVQAIRREALRQERLRLTQSSLVGDFPPPLKRTTVAEEVMSSPKRDAHDRPARSLPASEAGPDD